MTMGAGKTFTAATLSYRLLAHADARRILFLVDRNNLGRQTLKEFQAYRPPGTGRLFTELYNAQRLGPAGLDPSSKVVISTIQRVFAQLTGAELDEEAEEASSYESEIAGVPKAVAYSVAMPPETFDTVKVSMNATARFLRRLRQVLERFRRFHRRPDGHALGPHPGLSRRTLVAEYPYERSATDGVNVLKCFASAPRSASAAREAGWLHCPAPRPAHAPPAL